MLFIVPLFTRHIRRLLLLPSSELNDWESHKNGKLLRNKKEEEYSVINKGNVVTAITMVPLRIFKRQCEEFLSFKASLFLA